MARHLNKVMIIGNLGYSPELRYTPSGVPVTSFNVGVDREWNNNSGELSCATEWFNVVAWRELAERSSQLLSKGKLVYIEGSLQTRSWESTDGQRHYRMELVAEQLILLEQKTDQEAELEKNQHPTS